MQLARRSRNLHACTSFYMMTQSPAQIFPTPGAPAMPPLPYGVSYGWRVRGMEWKQGIHPRPTQSVPLKETK